MTVPADRTLAVPDPAPTPATGRVQLALDVDDLAAAVTFYARLLGTPPAKLRPGYANFAVTAPPLKLVLLENPGRGGRLNHLGVEVPDSEAVHAEITRLSREGLVGEEELATTCCFATQDKVWLTAPDGERWEVYAVLADSPTFDSSPRSTPPAPTVEQGRPGAPCCAGTDAAPSC